MGVFLDPKMKKYGKKLPDLFLFSSSFFDSFYNFKARELKFCMKAA